MEDRVYAAVDAMHTERGRFHQHLIHDLLFLPISTIESGVS